MSNFVNLMSEKAQFRAASKRFVIGWALALTVGVVALTPVGAYAWHKRGAAVAREKALEAQYEPIRVLSLENRRLRNEATALVNTERTALELARVRPPSTLLGLVGQAAAESEGDLYLRRLTLTQVPVHDDQAAAAADEGGRLALEASSSVAYDVQRFVKRLGQPPLGEVKLLSTETATDSGRTRKTHGIECAF